MKRLLKHAADRLHRRIARSDPTVAKVYLLALSALSRMAPLPVASRIYNSVTQCKWPTMGFAPRRVVVGNQTEILLHPHIGEFDFEALFTADMSYEREIFGWLEKHAPESYDTIVEIGANVGIYTVFFDRLSRKPGSSIRRILAFEPAHEPYRRLLQNSLANEVSLAQTYPIAISDRDGFVEFYEPEGHLTNGSLLTEYAGRYGAPYTTNLVPTLAASHLEPIFKSSQKVLLKIDVEGYEPHLLAAMRDLLQRYRPHLIIEVLRKTADPINECLPAATYEIFSIRDTGLVTVDRVAADPAFRDYFLKPFLPDLSKMPADAWDI